MISKTVNLIMTSLQIIIHKQSPVSINAPQNDRSSSSSEKWTALRNSGPVIEEISGLLAVAGTS